jgi:hypothetical protein
MGHLDNFRAASSLLGTSIFDKNAYSRMNASLATQLLSRSTVEMIRDALADEDIVLSLQKKGMYNHVADLCEHWNGVVDICNGRDGPHMPGNAAQRQTVLLKTLLPGF